MYDIPLKNFFCLFFSFTLKHTRHTLDSTRCDQCESYKRTKRVEWKVTEYWKCVLCSCGMKKVFSHATARQNSNSKSKRVREKIPLALMWCNWLWFRAVIKIILRKKIQRDFYQTWIMWKKHFKDFTDFKAVKIKIFQEI